MTSIAPWLSVPDAPAAVAFYAAGFGALERERLEDGGRVVVARLAIDGAEFWVAEDPDARPAGGSPVRMVVTVADPDALFAQALAAGAIEVFPVGEQHGWRVGRLVDPAGHHWELGSDLALPDEAGPN